MTKIANPALDHHSYGNARAGDGDSLENLTGELRTISIQLTEHVTKLEKCNSHRKERQAREKNWPQEKSKEQGKTSPLPLLQGNHS
jgi:hypothetical protein